MNNFLNKTKEKSVHYFHKWKKKKRFYVAIILAIVILFFVFRPKVDESVLIDSVKLMDLENTVSASGVIESNTDLALSFNSSGLVKNMYVKVGDKVKQGQVLASLNNGGAYGELQVAEGALKAAEAKYEKTLAGASDEEINLAEVALKNAKINLETTTREQNILVENALKKLMSDALVAKPENTYSTGTLPVVSGTYNSTVEGSYNVTTYASNGGGYFSVNGLGSGGGPLTATNSVLGDNGLYISFPSGVVTGESWTIDVPNKKSSTYLANLNAYNSAKEARSSAIATAESNVASKEAELALKRAKVRSFEIDLAEADVLSAQGQVGSARVAYENTIVRAPASGTITKVNVKLGELAEAQKEVIVLEDIDSLYLEANINEANIVKLKLGQQVSFVIDSFGRERVFEGQIIHIDPSATTTDGIANYKIKVAMNEDNPAVRPGMNADLDVLIEKKPMVLTVPKLAVVVHAGKSFVRVITDEKRRQYEEREVVTGMEGDGNLVEIISGVREGDKVAIVTKKI